MEYRLNGKYVWKMEGEVCRTHSYYTDLVWEEDTHPSEEIISLAYMKIIPKEDYHKYPIILKDLKDEFYKDILE